MIQRSGRSDGNSSRGAVGSRASRSCRYANGSASARMIQNVGRNLVFLQIEPLLLTRQKLGEHSSLTSLAGSLFLDFGCRLRRVPVQQPFATRPGVASSPHGNSRCRGEVRGRANASVVTAGRIDSSAEMMTSELCKSPDTALVHFVNIVKGDATQKNSGSHHVSKQRKDHQRQLSEACFGRQ